MTVQISPTDVTMRTSPTAAGTTVTSSASSSSRLSIILWLLFEGWLVGINVCREDTVCEVVDTNCVNSNWVHDDTSGREEGTVDGLLCVHDDTAVGG